MIQTRQDVVGMFITMRQATGRDGQDACHGKLSHFLPKMILRTITHINDQEVRYPISWWVRQPPEIRYLIGRAFDRVNTPA